MDTRRRVSAVTMHDGEQITAFKSGKLARSWKQNSLTDSESTGLKNCTALKWSTKRWNMYRNWRWSCFVYTACFCGRTVNQSRKVFIVALSDDQNLNDFKSILTVPPMWKELKKLWPFMILVWPTNNAAFSELRSHKDRLKTKYLWKEIGSFSTRRPFFPFRRTKEYIQFTDDLYLHKQILLEVFSSTPKMTQKMFLFSYKTSLVNVLWVTCFIFAIQ